MGNVNLELHSQSATHFYEKNSREMKRTPFFQYRTIHNTVRKGPHFYFKKCHKQCLHFVMSFYKVSKHTGFFFHKRNTVHNFLNAAMSENHIKRYMDESKYQTTLY